MSVVLSIVALVLAIIQVMLAVEAVRRSNRVRKLLKNYSKN